MSQFSKFDLSLDDKAFSGNAEKLDHTLPRSYEDLVGDHNGGSEIVPAHSFHPKEFSGFGFNAGSNSCVGDGKEQIIKAQWGGHIRDISIEHVGNSGRFITPAWGENGEHSAASSARSTGGKKMSFCLEGRGHASFIKSVRSGFPGNFACSPIQGKATMGLGVAYKLNLSGIKDMGQRG